MAANAVESAPRHALRDRPAVRVAAIVGLVTVFAIAITVGLVSFHVVRKGSAPSPSRRWAGLPGR